MWSTFKYCTRLLINKKQAKAEDKMVKITVNKYQQDIRRESSAETEASGPDGSKWWRKDDGDDIFEQCFALVMTYCLYLNTAVPLDSFDLSATYNSWNIKAFFVLYVFFYYLLTYSRPESWQMMLYFYKLEDKLYTFTN